MINQTEREEREYLEEIQEKLELAIRRTEDAVKQYSTELRQTKEYIYEHQSGMDDADKVAAEQSVNRMAFTGESAVSQKRKLQKLIDSPYFGRIDFITGAERNPVYIGVGTFSDHSRMVNLIYDWRAPICSLFYDFELGGAEYTTPSGTINRQNWLKWQYRIRQGTIEFLLSYTAHIQKGILQTKLRKAYDHN